MEQITSIKDERIQLARSLSSLKGRLESRKFLIEGTEALKWALEANIKVDCVFIASSVKKIDDTFKHLTCYTVTDGILKKITDTNYLIPVVAVGNIKGNNPAGDFVVVLDNVIDYGNIGTIIRTCNALGVDSVLSTKKDIDLFQRKTVDASRGKVYNTNFITFSGAAETIAYMKENNYQIVATSPYGESIQSLVALTGEPVALIAGNETDGISGEFIRNADITIQIPMHNSTESLNVGVAAGISIYELKLKQIIGMIEKKIKSTLGREINVAANLIPQVLDKELKKVTDLTSLQVVFLMVLKCDVEMSILDMQKQFGIPDNEINIFLNPLQAKGLITVSTGPELTITEKGIEVIGKLWTVIENAEALILADFTAQEKAELYRLINKLKDGCVKVIEKKAASRLT
jgi:TrmH family RNA methyltransferase